MENFWETGYGMPSFTLLGPTVLRFSFILHSSWPHEILHNWWGNGVFPPAQWGDWGGNWSEGLTAYLAVHLSKEQQGEGAEYRRDLLQKYADYVRAGNDFPVAELLSRHSGATAAVGYGKTAMVFHMLRQRLGDDAFVEGLRRFYRDHPGERASFDDLRRAFEAAGDVPLATFFDAYRDLAAAWGGARAGDEPQNVAKRSLQPEGSPLERILVPDTEPPPPAAVLPERPPLAELPPLPSSE